MIELRTFCLPVLASVALASCGGGAAAVPHAGAASDRGTLKIIVKKPAASTQSRPKYVAPTMLSLGVTIDHNAATFFNIGKTSTGCNPSGTSCTFTLAAPAGSHQLGLVAYDATNGGGSVLSTNSVTENIVGGQTNTFTITLNGIATSLSLVLSSASPPPGRPQTIGLSVNAYDADQNLIIAPGSYSNGPIKLSDTDATGATSLTSNGTTAPIILVSGPGTAVSVNYSGGFISPATILANTSASPSAQTSVTLTPTMPHNSWTGAAAMPTARFLLGVATIGSNLYAVGGENNTGFLSTLEIYNPASNAWSSGPPMPTPRRGLAVGAINGVLYAAGGQNVGNSSLSTVEAFTPGTGWSTKASMSTARYGPCAGVINGILYVAGGFNTASGTPVNSVESYDPIANQWTARAPMPTAVQGAAGTAFNGTLYCAGGASVSGAQSTLQEYSPGSNSWSTGPPMPTARAFGAADAVNGILYVLGGDSGNTIFSANEAFDTVAGTWSSKAQMPAQNVASGAGDLNGYLFAVGGFNNASLYLNTVQAYFP